jgi:hypothetical protein
MMRVAVAAEEGHVERIKVRGHAVGRCHRAQAHDMFVSPPSPITSTVFTGSSTANACQILS